MKKNYIEFCNEQAEKLFQIIDLHGSLLEWSKPWNVQGNLNMPRNGRRYYQGVNLWMLLSAQMSEGFTSNAWMTFNQVKQHGGYVLKGAKGQCICLFKTKEIEDVKDAQDKQKLLSVLRWYTVFNLDQTSLSGQALYENSLPQKFEVLLAKLGINIVEFSNRACFNPAEDVIIMPRREFFTNSQDYDITLLHEIIHWTGHSARLDRMCANEYTKSPSARAEEELVAEIGSVFLSVYFGISGNLINHASYINEWKKFIHDKAVGRAISQASKAFHWLIAHIEEQKREDEAAA